LEFARHGAPNWPVRQHGAAHLASLRAEAASPCIDLGYEKLAFADEAIQTLTAQHADFDFHHVEPTCMSSTGKTLMHRIMTLLLLLDGHHSANAQMARTLGVASRYGVAGG
jgi:hypothetical protein